MSSVHQILNPGDTVYFGTDDVTGKPEEWVVLMTNSDEKTTLIASTEAVDRMPYVNSFRTDVAKPAAWNTSLVRKYLNGEYYFHFNRQERKAIHMTPVPDYEGDPEPELSHIFILSEGEASLFFKNNENRVLLNLRDEYDDPIDGFRTSCSWWLRDPSVLNEETGIMQVPVCTEKGELGQMMDVSSFQCGVRACMWVDTDALVMVPEPDMESIHVRLLETNDNRIVTFRNGREQVMDILAAFYDYDLQQTFAVLQDTVLDQPVVAKISVDLFVKSSLVSKYKPLVNALKRKPYHNMMDFLQHCQDKQTVAAWMRQKAWAPTPGNYQPEIDDSGKYLIQLGRNTLDQTLTDDRLYWRVIKRKSNKVLCVCETGLILDEFLTFHYGTHPEERDWETSSLREWLNGDFMKSAFTDEEISRLMNCNTVEENEFFPHIFDRVFLLSDAEVSIFMPSESERIIRDTPSAQTLDETFELPLAECRENEWWLRTPGRKAECFCFVDAEGKINRDGMHGYEDTFAIRPAILVELTDVRLPCRRIEGGGYFDILYHEP